jgi:tubulin epsilon
LKLFYVSSYFPYRAEGFHTHGSEYSEKILNILQRSAEQCDQLHGFLCLFSLGGGTGSGLGSSMLSILEDNFPHVERYEWLEVAWI